MCQRDCKGGMKVGGAIPNTGPDIILLTFEAPTMGALIVRMGFWGSIIL